MAGPSIASGWTQTRPPKAAFTETNLPDLQGKIYIVTGGNGGVGKELVRILYSKNAKVYVAARSEDKARAAMKDVESSVASSKGELVFLPLDLADLNNVAESARRYLAAETRLDVLFNNAGVMTGNTQPAPRTAQGYELNVGVNCIGTFLFTKLLSPLLVQTSQAESAKPSSVRVVWASSFGLELYAEKDVAINAKKLDYDVFKQKAPIVRYGFSKVGAWALGVDFARRFKREGVVSIPINPGNLKSDLARDQSFSTKLMTKMVCYPPVNGAYTFLFAGLSPEVTLEKSGDWVVPFGRFYPLRKDLPPSTKPESEGGNGGTQKFWDWVEAQVQSYC